MKKWVKYPELQRARIWQCPVCLNSFRAINDTYKRKQKYCCKECWGNRRVLNKCEWCWWEITSYHAKKYCTKECAQKTMVWDKAPQWIDWKSLERDRARQWKQLKEWKKSVKERDDYTCVKCWNKEYLHAHHIIEWAKDETKRFDIDNWITVCVECHSEIHWKWIWSKKHPKYCDVIVNRMKKLDPSIVIKRNWVHYKSVISE